MGLFGVPQEEHDCIVNRLVFQNRNLQYQGLDVFAELLLEKLRNHAPEVEQHSRRVAAIIREILESKKGLKPSHIKTAYLTALLHDIGKLELPADVALQSGTGYFESVNEQIRNHPSLGVKIIRKYAARWPELESAILNGSIISLQSIESHHERKDGNGYPNRFRSIDISLEAKLIAIVDAFDHLTFRTDKPGMTMIDAVNELVMSDVYEPPIIGALGKYVGSKARLAERTDIGGPTAAVETGLNDYVRKAQSLLRDDPELSRIYNRLTTANQRERNEIISNLSDGLTRLLSLPPRCIRNVLLKICKQPLDDDIKREDIDLDDESLNNLIDDYKQSERNYEIQGMRIRYHLEIVLPISNMSQIKSLPIIAFNPKRTHEKCGQAELWYCTVVDKENVWLMR